MLDKEKNLPAEPAPRFSTEKYPAEIRRLGIAGMLLFDNLYQNYIEQGHSSAEAFFYAASRTPTTFRTQQRRTLARLDPI